MFEHVRACSILELVQLILSMRGLQMLMSTLFHHTTALSQSWSGQVAVSVHGSFNPHAIRLQSLQRLGCKDWDACLDV